jgi:hypothetical protein
VGWVVLLTMLLVGAGTVFIVIALNDKVDARSDDGSRRLPTRREQPLYHLHMRIRSSTKPSSGSRASTRGISRFPRRR